ncbi:DNA internalization-related competence protein ComEC/Rec2 [alpha proteobacterium U9-1i]|nr:DNA internalization-related competence protein ComEC/Rec2 [alpha proteobacterium U9-1i]
MRDVLAGAWAAQRDRWILWLPVATIAGAAFWLVAPTDPSIWLGAGLVVGAALLIAAGLLIAPGAELDLLRVVTVASASLALAAGLGIGAAQVRTHLAATPAIVGDEEPRGVEGWVIAVESSTAGPRLRLITRAIEGSEAVPRYVRVSVPAAGMLTPGRAARCFAVLAPPAGPMAPGAYDFARRAYFERLGATGFGFGRCRPAAFGAPPSWWDQQRLRLAALRWDLSETIQAASPGRGGAIAAALVSGDRSAIDTETNEALTNSGLGHLLSVSGIHMGVVGGLVFGALLWLFALIPPIALRWPVKKIAAIGALTSLAVYLVISGSSVPALRAFVMACVAFGAILLDRPAISMRGLALAALIVTLAFPESVLEPGFQMSFAATMALVALFEMSKRPASEPALPTPGPLIGALQWSSRSIGGVILISLVAGLATDPFAIYHFQRFSIYALPANLIAAPIMSFLVAPAAGVAAVLAPFGLADPAIELMSSALDLIAAIGQTFGVRPEAVRALPKPPDLAFLLCVLALLWASLWRGWVRCGALVFLAASVVTYARTPLPIAAFDGDLRAVFAQTETGAWTLLQRPGRSTYVRDRLGGMLGLSPAQLERIASPEACGETLCTLREGEFALVRSLEVVAAHCAPGAVLITTFNVSAPSTCPDALVIDPANRAQLGGGLIYAEADGFRIERAWPVHISRAWTPAQRSDDGQE